MQKKCYVTTPIYYVTAKPHLGSLYSTLIADVIARHAKLQGKDAFFLTGTDEHGQKVAEAAQKAGTSPKIFVDSFIDAYKTAWNRYEIQYDAFIRTTDIHHVKAVQEWIVRLQKQGDIYKALYEGWYCTPCETFVTEKESEVKGQAPTCPSCGRETKALSEETYFFKLSAYQDKLLAFYEQNPDFILPKERMKEVVNFVKEGLRDLSISRTTVTWGIPFPGDEKHVTYVWADALNNYITAIGYGQEDKQKEFAKWWPADVQVMGKDIVRFHAIYWPAFLMASGLPLPKHLLVHGWILVDKNKMSKSLGNVVDPMYLFEQYGADAVRYYLMRQMAVTHDSNFSIEDLERHIETDLANDLGNLLNRMSSLAEKQHIFDIKHPDIWSESAMELRSACWDMLEEFERYMAEYQFHMALASAWKFINKANAYFHSQEPWKLAKSNPAAFAEVLSATCHSLHVIGYILWPVMPQKMEQLLASLGRPFNLEEDKIEKLEFGNWNKEFLLRKIDTLFIKPEPKEETMEIKEEQKPVVAPSDEITIDDVMKVQMVVGTVEKCETLEASDKLYVLQVNFGDKGVRQILSGVRKSFTPEELIGKQGVFAFNLKPRKMLGLESQGMMLFAKDTEGRMVIATVGGPVANGTRLQ